MVFLRQKYLFFRYFGCPTYNVLHMISGVIFSLVDQKHDAIANSDCDREFSIIENSKSFQKLTKKTKPNDF